MTGQLKGKCLGRGNGPEQCLEPGELVHPGCGLGVCARGQRALGAPQTVPGGTPGALGQVHHLGSRVEQSTQARGGRGP